METFFKKYFWAAQAGAVIIAALLLAGTVNGFVASAYAKYSVATPENVDGPPLIDIDEDEQQPVDPTLLWPPEPPPPVIDLCAEVQCEENQECNPETGTCEDVVDVTASTEDDGRCIESDIAINLIGTMVSDDPNWSIAILHNPSVDQTQFAQLGTNLLAEADVTRIERGRIFFMRNGREECLRPGDQQARASRAPQQRPNTAPSRTTQRPTTAVERPSRPSRPTANNANSNQSIEERIRSGISRAADGSYEVPRDLIQDVANDSALMESQAPRVLPNYVNGQPAGFRLQGIRSGSMFSAIGIRNGDVLVSVNGTQIDSPQRAMELYQALLQQENVALGILRRGQEHTLNYTIK